MLDKRDLADIVLSVLDDPGTEHNAERIVSYATKAVECDHAGLMLLQPRHAVETVATTDPAVGACDQLQFDLNEGPCLDAITDGETYLSADLATDPRWPRWGPKVAGLGFSSILSVRLFTHSATVGALNLYGVARREFDADDVAVALLFGQYASAALAVARRHEQLQQAVTARHHVGLAQGVLMERHGLDADAAFEVLRRYSRDSNRKLRDVARDVIASRRPQ